MSPRTGTYEKFCSTVRFKSAEISLTEYSGRLVRGSVREGLSLIGRYDTRREAREGAADAHFDGGIGRTRACTLLGDCGIAALRCAVLRARQPRHRGGSALHSGRR